MALYTDNKDRNSTLRMIRFLGIESNKKDLISVTGSCCKKYRMISSKIKISTKTLLMTEMGSRSGNWSLKIG